MTYLDRYIYLSAAFVSHLFREIYKFIMGNSRSCEKLEQTDITAITEETGFSPKQIKKLFRRFSSLDKESKGYLNREDFLRLTELAVNPLGDRIVNAFFLESQNDEVFNDDTVDFRDFIRVLSHFRPIEKNEEKNKLNTRLEKLRFAFRIYDLDGDDKICKEELLSLLTMMVGENVSSEQLISITERTILEADKNKDSFISFEEFAKVLQNTDINQKMSIRFLN